MSVLNQGPQCVFFRCKKTNYPFAIVDSDFPTDDLDELFIKDTIAVHDGMTAMSPKDDVYLKVRWANMQLTVKMAYPHHIPQIKTLFLEKFDVDIVVEPRYLEYLLGQAKAASDASWAAEARGGHQQGQW